MLENETLGKLLLTSIGIIKNIFISVFIIKGYEIEICISIHQLFSKAGYVQVQLIRK